MLALAAVAIAIGIVLTVDRPTSLGPVLPAQNQDAETRLYLLGYFVILPLAIVAGARLADRIASGPNRAGLGLLTGILAVTLSGLILAVRVSAKLPWGDGVGVLLGAALIWSVIAAVLLLRAARPEPWPALLRHTDAAGAVWTLTAILAFGILLAVTTPGSIDPFALAVGAAAVVGFVWLSERVALPRPKRRWGIAVDLAVITVVVLAVIDLVVFRSGADIGGAIQNGIIRFHQNFLLGPANEVLGGDAMLVDTASQYGVGSIYFLAGWFQLAPIGYGTFGFLSGLIAGLLFAAGYGVLRMAGTSRLLSAGAIAVGVITLIYNLIYGIGGIPQSGPIRFGMPMVLIVAAVIAARRPRLAGPAWIASLAIAALASIWALEAFAYTLAVLAVLACLEAYLGPPGGRLRRLLLQAAQVLAACVAAQLLFALATLALAGQLPDWGQYLAYLRRFVIGPLGDFTFDIAPWSPGLAVGAAYLVSAAAIVQLAWRRRELVERERVAFVALAGTTAYGIALFSYFDNRSGNNIVPLVSLPLLLAAALWLGLVLRQREAVPRAARRTGLALGLSAAALAVSVAWSSVPEAYPRSALAHVIPGGSSLNGALHRLWNPPPLDGRATEGEQLLDRFSPGPRPIVLVDPDLTTEILIRTERTNDLPLGDAWEDSFVPGQRLPGLREAVDEMRPGDRILTEPEALVALARLRRNPEIDPLKAPNKVLYPGVPIGILPARGELARLQLWALRRIGERFRLRRISRPEGDLVVVELEPRRR
jgi:hypothetical protein